MFELLEARTYKFELTAGATARKRRQTCDGGKHRIAAWMDLRQSVAHRD
jgi:hypothetical protein